MVFKIKKKSSKKERKKERMNEREKNYKQIMSFRAIFEVTNVKFDVLTLIFTINFDVV